MTIILRQAPFFLLGVQLLLAHLTQLTHQVDFKDGSFSIKSIVFVSERESYFDYRLHESYSIEQRRAKLTYKFNKPNPTLPPTEPKVGIFFSDNYSSATLLFDAVDYRCKQTSIKDITSFLGLDKLKYLDSGKTQAAEEFIVGPSRVLYLLDKHKDKLKYLGKMAIRNVFCVYYELKDVLDDKITLVVYYTESSVAEDPDALPIQIHISLDESYIVIDFAHVELIPPANSGPVSDKNHVQLKTGTQLDPFAFPVVAGCSGALADKTEELFADKSRDMSRFSFTAEMEFSLPISNVPIPVKIKSYVAFDAAIDALRLDLDANALVSGVRKQLLNFKLNRMYHSVEIIDDSSNSIDQVVELSRKDGPASGGATSLSTQCQVGRLMVPDKKTQSKENERLSIGKILIGADKFLYMGRATVRGVPAKVYEAHEVYAPLWWDQPVAYRTTSGDWRLREPHAGARPDAKGHLYDIVLYVSDQEEHGPLLLLEMYKLKGTVSLFNEKETVKFYDFMWDLDHEAPNGDRPSELFSLEDVCSAGIGANEYARVDLLLESKATFGSAPNLMLPCAVEECGVDAFKFGSAEERHLALLASLQESLDLTSTMIYDLETKLIGPQELQTFAPRSGSEEQSQLVMAVSFRVAEHTDDMAGLVYVGQGRVYSLYTGERTTAPRRSFQACYFLAAHRRINVYFGYDIENKLCSVDLEPATGPFNHAENPAAFILDPKDTMEIYRISRVNDPIEARSSDWFEVMSRPKNKHKIIGRNLRLKQVGPQGTDLDFIVKRARLDDKDYKTSLGQQSDQLKTEMITGFGLIESARLCKRILPAPLRSTNQSPLSAYLKDSPSQMTHEQCQAACLTDASCQSYSVCLRNAELICMTSSLSFRSDATSQQLAAAIKESNGSKKRRSLDIKMDDGDSLEISQDPNCQLYNKIYLDLFREPVSDIGRNLNTRRVHPVQSEEACAKMCMEQNIEILHQDLNQASESYSIFSETGGETKVTSDQLVGLRAVQRKITNKFCKAFLYLDRLKITGEMDENEIRRRVVESEQGNVDQCNGYCVVNDQPSKELAETSSEKNNVVRMDLYRFKTEIFYEKQFGAGLRASPLDDGELSAYRKALRHSGAPVKEEINEESLSKLHSMIVLGDNFQERFFDVDESSCALGCFMQSWGPWPACRSFDVAYEQRHGRRSTRVVCYLNSITMHQAVETEHFDLIKEANPRQHQLWHYEPRPGFVSAESDFSAKMRDADAEYSATFWSARHNLRLRTFGIFLVIMVAVGTGLFLGAKLGVIVNDRRRVTREDRKALVARAPITIEFCNQVNSEGLIPE